MQRFHATGEPTKSCTLLCGMQEQLGIELQDITPMPSKLKSMTTSGRLELFMSDLIRRNPMLTPALAPGHIFFASTLDKLFSMVGCINSGSSAFCCKLHPL